MNRARYLGVIVTVLQHDADPQWVWCRWPDGRKWRHWHEQLEPVS